MNAFDIVRDAITKHVDAKPEDVHLDSQLADLDIDSLTLADLLFEFEDHVGKGMKDPTERPQTVEDLVNYVAPYLAAAEAVKAA